MTKDKKLRVLFFILHGGSNHKEDVINENTD